jgi:hypothetical protein
MVHEYHVQRRAKSSRHPNRCNSPRQIRSRPERDYAAGVGLEGYSGEVEEMKVLKISSLVVVMLLLFSQSLTTRAQRISTTTGNTLLENSESEIPFQRGGCIGYIMGVSDRISINSVAYKDRPQVCMPDEATNGQIKDVVVNHLKEAPEHRHMNAAILVFESLAKAFPCSNR